ncbi:MAG TPA: class I tRNA ligase family protein, partial [Bacteroidales bacterium]|nr:class I tRNA ligase family protein [Bacteroidales bacterium]
EFSGWYLEIIKPDYQKPIDQKTYNSTIEIFDSLLKILHPFMPFITEEIWHLLEERKDGDSLMIERMPVSNGYDSALVGHFETAKEIVSSVRTIRKEKNIKNAEKLALLAGTSKSPENSLLNPVIIKLCNLTSVDYVEEKVEGAASFRVSTTEYYVPVAGSVDKEAELKKLREELSYTEGFLASVMSKLNNEKFTAHAPAKVIEMERKKQSDAELKIATLKAGISMLE